MQEGPILIIENVKPDEWIEKVKPSIVSRINLYSQSEIKFNLLSIIPDRKMISHNEEANLIKRKQFEKIYLTKNKT